MAELLYPTSMMSREVIIGRDKLLDFFQRASFWEEFGNSYRNMPWEEYLYCPKCKSFDDFGPKNSYGFDWFEKNNTLDCPVCSTRMARFWSRDRIWHYFEIQTQYFSKEFRLIVCKENNKYVGFIFGNFIVKEDISDLNTWFYQKGVKSAFYIDLIFVSAPFRRSRGSKGVIAAIFIFAKMFFSPLKYSTFDRLIKVIGNPVVFFMFTELIEQCRLNSVFDLMTRTHKAAKNVKFILRLTGFKRSGISSKDDETREYLYISLPKGV